MLPTLAVLPLFAALPQAAPHDVIYTQIAGSSTSEIPSVPGAFFDNFYEIRVSPSGNHWVFTGTRNSSSSFDDLTIVNGQLLFLQFFGTLPWDNTQGWSSGWTDVNDAGELLVASAGPNSAVGHLVHSPNLGGAWNIIHTEGDAVIGIPGATHSAWLNPCITNNAQFGYRSDLLGITAAEDESQHFNGSVLLQKGVTVPPGQQAGNDAVQGLDFHEFGLEVSADGQHWMTRVFLGPTGGSAERAVVYDGSVVLETDVIIPGAGFTRPVQFIDGAYMTPGGTWFAWGRNEPNTYRDWVVKEGVVIAQENQPIVPGSSENWASFSNLAAAFRQVRGSASGDTLIHGYTNGLSNWVVVRNGSDVVLKYHDEIDLDGNGLFDDDVHLASITELSDWAANGDLWAICTLHNGSFAQLGSALIRFRIDSGGVGVPFCSPADVNSTGVPTTMTASLGSGVGSGLHLEVQNGPSGQFGYFLLGTAFADPGIAVSQGHLCVSGAIGRFNVLSSVRNSTGMINASGVFDNLVGTATSSGGTGFDVPTAMPITGSPAITPGSTWSFQFWHRENGGQSNFSNGLAVTF